MYALFVAFVLTVCALLGVGCLAEWWRTVR
jgi:hypothetical protein